MKKSITSISALLLSISLLVGCSSGNGNGETDTSSNTNAAPENAEPSAAEEKVELTWWVDSRADIQDTYETIKNDFETANPNVTINLVQTPDDKIAERISIAINTEELPDVQQGSIGWPLTYAKKDLLVPLDDVVEKEDYDQGPLNSLSVDNKLYILPNSLTAPGMLVNRELFTAKNALDLLPQNMETWTYDQFVEAAKAVNDPDQGIYGFGTYAGDIGGDQGHHMFLWGFGAKTWSDDKTKAILNSPEGVEGLEYLVNIINEEGITPPGVVGLKAGAVINEMFLQGKIGMTFGSLGNISAFDKAFADGTAKAFEYDIVPFPSKDGTTSNSVLFGYGTWAWNTKDETRIKWSKELVKFINSKESMTKMASVPSVIVTRKSLNATYEPDSIQGKTIQLAKYAGDIGLAIPGYAETRNAFFPELQAAIMKSKTAQQALDEFVAKANRIIEQNSK
ncbi:sugar ABC transporter substrate-binding protein [Paenibacillus sp.]|uniref:ABC transporter substrate-binding protein n=1 Tax=Paenibacillus sp. TaxID=58172 RepID=UPI00281284AA|nr:sugar ABC transporter substrate-binding protein [Paenibacillus sp.]